MDKHLISYYIGIVIIFLTHIFMLFSPDSFMDKMKGHAITNLLAGLLIAYYFMNKEMFISF